MPNPIICGPIVRKVSGNSVNVFIALNKFLRVGLHLYSDPLGTESMAEAENDPKQIGEKLWVMVITINNLSLVPAKNYHYNLTLFNGVTGTTEDLSSLGFLQEENPILGVPLGYEAGSLPGFALPPGLAHLNIIHGSCRKPHGKGPDQLALLDKLIEADYHDPLRRPHQLFLTGDQIYADDVVEELSEMLAIQGPKMLGVQEYITDKVMQGHTETQTPNRRLFLDNQTKLSSGEKKFHLVYLSEFYSMYLFAWSGFPLTPEELKKEQAFSSNLELRDYAQTLPYIRRALANIPSYMIFDDHEITDDWYLDGKWKQDALSHLATCRIIRNGLIAYAVFQDWGNQPEKYEDLDFFWDAINYKSNGNNGKIDILETPDPSGRIYGYLGLLSQAHPDLHDWYYQLSFSEHRVFVLDARTKRQYHGSFTQLIGQEDFHAQMPLEDNLNKVIFIVAPTPVLGMPIIEEAQRLLVKQAMRLKATTLDDETWIGDPQTFNLLLSHLANFRRVVILSGDVHYGYTNSCAIFTNETSDTTRVLQLCSSSLKNGGCSTKVPALIDHLIEQESFAIYDEQYVNDLNVKVNLIGKGIYATVSRTFLKLNPRIPSPIRVFTFPDLRQWKDELAQAVDLQQVRESYTITYLDHQLTTKYSSNDPFNPKKNQKIVGNTNIGQVTFEIAEDRTWVIHQMHLATTKDKNVFLCKAELTPPSNSEKPSL